MFNKFKQHPYIAIILMALVASLIGIGIQYAIDQTIYRSGLYSTIFLTGFFLLLTYQKNKKK
ncbi:hypothetical protein G7081_00435 [Vagococcus coleopterorum]|uniref:Uncharacterized protein n=1 Tax=Vagococcus coleopterorum TaxID=2714946 RepID=A0A6G8AL20_9ENTE|nr:hypothetical protein G7081_00435 [Vagococcus coleopterorum]